MTTPQFDMLLTDEEITRFTESGHWKNKLLIDYFDEAVAQFPDKLCTVDMNSRHTYAGLAEDVEIAAYGLRAFDVKPGDVVAIQLPNWYEWLVIHLAAQRVGAITNPLIPIYRDREISHMAKVSRASIIFIPETFRHFNYVDMVDRLRDDLPDLRRAVVVRGEAVKRGFDAWDSFMEAGKAARESEPIDFSPFRPDPNDLALIMFTSGTTGKSKGVMHTHNSVLAGAMPWPDKLGMDDSAVIHMASTFGHLTGYLYGVSLPFILGGTAVIQDVWNVDYFVYLVEKYGINHTSGAAPFLHDLLAAENLHHYDLSSLKRFCCMGASIPRSFITQAKEKLPEMRVFGGWGMTECCLSTMGHPNDPEEKVATTDGRPLDGMEVRTVDENGDQISDGQPGKLQVRGPFMFRGYLGQLDVTLEEFDDTWFNTGDLATIDEDGYVSLSGRSKDVVIRGGENIPVAEVENALYQHPDIKDVVVVAMPHDRLQEIAAAVVVLEDDVEPITMETMQKHLESKAIAKQYWPEYLDIVDALPRTPSGKPQKFKLRERMAQIAEELKNNGQMGAPAEAPGSVKSTDGLSRKSRSFLGAVDVTQLDSAFNSDEKALALKARRFVDKEIRPNIAEWFEKGVFPKELARELGSQGFLGMPINGYGCPGRSHVEYGLVAQELEAGDSGIRTFVSVQGSLTMSALFKHGSLDQKLEWLPKLASGEAIGCFGLTEPTAGSDPASMQTVAKQEPRGDWVLNGTKRWIGLANIADVAIIWAQTEGLGNGKGIRGFVVPTDTPGFNAQVIENKLTMRASVQCEITLEDVRLPATAMLPKDSAVGLSGPLACLNEARYGISWGVLGAARDAFNAALDYADSRSQFQSPLTHFQLTQEKLANMAVAINKGFHTAHHIGRLADTTGLTPEMISVGKLDNTRTAIEVVKQARTLLGGNGSTLEYSPLRHMVNLEAVRTYEGTDEVHLLTLGRSITGVGAFSTGANSARNKG